MRLPVCFAAPLLDQSENFGELVAAECLMSFTVYGVRFFGRKERRSEKHLRAICSGAPRELTNMWSLFSMRGKQQG